MTRTLRAELNDAFNSIIVVELNILLSSPLLTGMVGREMPPLVAKRLGFISARLPYVF